MIQKIFLKMVGPQIIASIPAVLCLLIDSIMIGRGLGGLMP